MKHRTKWVVGTVSAAIILISTLAAMLLLVDITGMFQDVESAGEPASESSPPDRSPIDRILERLAYGNIAFNAPETLNVESTAIIQLVLGLEVSIDELKRKIEAAGVKEGARIRISDRMEARLTGPGFSITAITPEIQAVSQSETTEWRWEVKPSIGGRHNLHLTLSALLNVNGQSTPRAIRTFGTVIEVEVTWYQEVSSFVGANWQWLWAAILVPIGGWLWAQRKRSKTLGRAD